MPLTPAPLPAGEGRPYSQTSALPDDNPERAVVMHAQPCCCKAAHWATQSAVRR